MKEDLYKKYKETLQNKKKMNTIIFLLIFCIFILSIFLGILYGGLYACDYDGRIMKGFPIKCHDFNDIPLINEKYNNPLGIQFNDTLTDNLSFIVGCYQ